MQPFSSSIHDFIATVHWTYAKTMPEWPHEYIVRAKVEERLFVDMVNHIRSFGYLGSFYAMPITYFDEDGMVYWTMGAPIDETIIINRCRKDNSYEARLQNRTLPITK